MRTAELLAILLAILSGIHLTVSAVLFIMRKVILGILREILLVIDQAAQGRQLIIGIMR